MTILIKSPFVKWLWLFRSAHFAAFFLCVTIVHAQKVEPHVISERIEKYKNDPRGPYKDIRWFCKDGMTLPPAERCPKPGGVQRARMKDEVLALANTNHIFLGQILATTGHADFWDEKNAHSRIKQYQLERFLKATDDGWVLRKAQFYRGAFQAEDEEAWGIEFFKWLLREDAHLTRHFFLIRQSVKDIPHRGDDSRTLRIRAVSKTISDSYPPFMDLRVKIHGQPEIADIAKVISFRDAHRTRLTADLLSKFDQLIGDMQSAYKTVDLNDLGIYLKDIPQDHLVYKTLTSLIDNYEQLTPGMSKAMALSENLMAIRENIITIQDPLTRLALLDLSIRLEELFVIETSAWRSTTISEALDKICYTGMAATGSGFLELWEWDAVVGTLATSTKSLLSLTDLQGIFETGRHLLEWGTGMVRATYGEVISVYSAFEPMTSGFLDDRIRGSALLPLGESISVLGNVVAQHANLSNQALGIPSQEHMRGLNPGFARGPLVVITGDAENVEVSPEKIYVFERPPSDLKPVAGIATVTEGNLVSHVQLLARNLGIPNTVISQQNLNSLKRFEGREIFYAVSRRGTVIMKEAENMTAEEKELFAIKTRNEEKVRVPIDKIDLQQTAVLDMRNVNAAHSGKLCGPKAANLGQLKSLFPQNVVEGIVIPFGIFRTHMNQQIPGQGLSYWDFLQATFREAGRMRSTGALASDVEKYTLGQLQILREAIRTIALSEEFVTDLESKFKSILGYEIGSLPVFLRSDTNMEDLKDFTGAGLNLTVFNVVARDKILQGIRDVWASPYTERSFKWRQSFLLNPENVFPSILIIPSVDVECSGVMITKGVQTGNQNDVTIAFNRGAGGAVDGQAAESYVLRNDGSYVLITPAREPTYRKLPSTGGTEIVRTTFEQRILNEYKLSALRTIAGEIKRKLPGTPGIESPGPYDVELGFKDGRIYLFQVRPFVENKNALSSNYLESITPKIPENKKMPMNFTLVK